MRIASLEADAKTNGNNTRAAERDRDDALDKLSRVGIVLYCFVSHIVYFRLRMT